MDVKKNIILRTRVGFLGLFIFGIIIVAKLIYIQWIQGNQWKQIAQSGNIEYRPIKPTRGNIYAQNGSLLATSLPFYQLAIDPCLAADSIFEQHVGALSTRLANFYKDKSPLAYQKLLREARKSKKKYLLINPKQIDYHQKKAMSQWPLLREGRFRGGAIFEKIEKRFRPFQELASRTLGFINTNNHGVGLEYSFNHTLHGIDGGALYQKMSGGSWKMIPSNNTQKPIHGADLITTIDINLQDIAHTSLLKVLRESQANYGLVVVMEVTTGEIKAMVNLGKTAPNQYREIYNYALGNQGTTEPGSSFKLIAMMALLEETNLPLNHLVDTEKGAYKFYDLTMHDTKKEGYGIITLEEVFAQSSNIGLAKLVDSVFNTKPQRFIEYVQKLGLDKPLGCQLKGEAQPFVKTPKHPEWSKVTLPWMSMGYEIKLSPLQLLAVYNAIANRGVMVQPLLIKKIQNAYITLQAFSPTIINKKICSEATLKKLRAMLESVVERGTARKFRHGFYKIAGKSGTSNKIENGKYSNATYASFVGYFPADNPRYSCIVVIDNPQGEQHHFGGQVAAPVVKEIADKLSGKDLVSSLCIIPPSSNSRLAKTFPAFKPAHREDWHIYLKMLNIPHPSLPSNHEWLQIIPTNEGTTWQPYGLADKKHVPNVLNQCLRDALYLLENQGYQVHTQGPLAGYVKKQFPKGGTAAAPGTTVLLELV